MTDYFGPIRAIFQLTYLSLLDNQYNKDTSCDFTILAPKLSIINEVNTYMLSRIDSRERIPKLISSLQNKLEQNILNRLVNS